MLKGYREMSMWEISQLLRIPCLVHYLEYFRKTECNLLHKSAKWNGKLHITCPDAMGRFGHWSPFRLSIQAYIRCTQAGNIQFPFKTDFPKLPTYFFLILKKKKKKPPRYGLLLLLIFRKTWLPFSSRFSIFLLNKESEGLNINIS